MPSFDVVSEVDKHELSNAIDQVNREIGTRFDFKGSDSKVELSGDEIKMEAESDFQLKQISPILYNFIFNLSSMIFIFLSFDFGTVKQSS